VKGIDKTARDTENMDKVVDENVLKNFEVVNVFDLMIF